MIYKKTRNTFSIVFALSLVVALLSINLPRASAAGSHLDTAFSTDGKVQINFFADDIANDVAVQANGKIVVAGTSDTDFAVARLNPNGSLDDTFNATGTVKTPVLGDGAVTAVAVQTDGKIVVAGRAVVNGIQQFCLVRYNTNGSIDTTFDGNGIVYTPFTPFDTDNTSSIRDMIIQPDGKIVAVGGVSGTFGGSPRSDWALARYNTNGSLDTTFHGDGKITVDFGGNTSESAGSVVVQSNGRIVAGGTGSNRFILAGFTADGLPDNDFGGSGRVFTAFDGLSSILLTDIELRSDGKIIAVGYGDDGFGFRIGLAQYNANGSLDASFDGDGRRLDGYSFPVSDMILQSDGKIVVICSSLFALKRFNPDGSTDAGFGQNGDLFTQFGSNFANVNAIAVQPDGKLVAAGQIRPATGGSTPNDFVVVRYLPNMGKPFDFDGDGKTDLSIFRPAGGEWWYLKSSNGGNAAAQFGTSTDRITPADFTGDGKTDIAFWRPSTGFWFVLRSEDFSFYSFPFGTSGDVPAPADFDGDDKTDAAVFRPSNATWYISRSTGGSTIQQFGANGDVPAAGNYDSDGKADIAIFRPSSGQWWINRSQGGTIAFTFGNGTDKPVQGDYTGDGKTDVAVWRPSTGEWFVLRSENNSFYSFPFGANGDTPAPGDFDGDGKFDATVFRPSNATWYVNKSTGGNLIQAFGAAGDIPTPNAFVP